MQPCFCLIQKVITKLIKMNKFIKVIVYSLGILLLVVFGFLTYVKLALPDVGPPPDIKIEATAEKIHVGVI